MNSFSSRLIHLRKEKGLTQEELAKEINVSRVNLSYYENGQTMPRKKVLDKIAKVLNCKVADLIATPEHPIDWINRPEDCLDYIQSPFSEDDHLLIAAVKIISRLSKSDKIKALSLLDDLTGKINKKI
ncbi:MAG: helix-turn-helix transcriptional regulator [Lentisphaerae bacterium]|nr:helix-turn-helix transcriptional regulator [Lentisphaerota bacterium]MCP4100077.1 helix-turn-helix transcriptional regulator [Lentisphaerota bacterium]